MRASIADIVRFNEIDCLVEKGFFTSFNDIFEMETSAKTVLPHYCSKRCWSRIFDGDGPEFYICHKLNNLKLSSGNTKHSFTNLPPHFTTDRKTVYSELD